MWDFHAGQEVVCIRDDWTSIWYTAPHYPAPKRHDIVKIKRISTVDAYMAYWWPALPRKWTNGADLVLLLDRYGEVAFLAEYFRPLKKTNIDQFKALLEPKSLLTAEPRK